MYEEHVCNSQFNFAIKFADLRGYPGLQIKHAIICATSLQSKYAFLDILSLRNLINFVSVFVFFSVCMNVTHLKRIKRIGKETVY